MKRNTAVLMFAMLAACKLAMVHAAEDADREKFQGDWKVEGGEKAGQAAHGDHFKDATFTFDGDTFICKMGAKETKGTFTIDSSKSPREISVTVDGTTHLGIYKLDGDDLKICAGDERPKEFATKEGAKQVLLSLKRKKP